MAIRLTITDRPFIPDVLFVTDEGRKRNRDLPPEDQVSVELTLASVGEKSEYLGSYTIGTRKNIAAGEVKQFTVLHDAVRQ